MRVRSCPPAPVCVLRLDRGPGERARGRVAKHIRTASIEWSVGGCLPKRPDVHNSDRRLRARDQLGNHQQTTPPTPRLYRHAPEYLWEQRLDGHDGRSVNPVQRTARRNLSAISRTHWTHWRPPSFTYTHPLNSFRALLRPPRPTLQICWPFPNHGAFNPRPSASGRAENATIG